MPPSLTALAARLPQTVPFTGPEAIERRIGQSFRARLGANESGFGAAPNVLARMSAAAGDSWKYGDPEVFDLRAALSAHLGIAHDAVTIGPGVDALLGLAVRLYAAPSDVVVNSLGGYPTFNYHVAGYGAQLHTVPYRNDRADLPALAEAARDTRARIVYLANPDNPMGSWWDASSVLDFIAQVPEDCLVILDEAYGECAPAGTLPPITLERPNLLRFRTFSKAYGMAGVRVGYGFGTPALIAPFDRVRDHFGVGSIAQAGALAALADQVYLQIAITRIAAARDRIAAIARDNGLQPLPSATNFVAIDCGRDAAYAQAILDGLAQRGVFIRKPGAPGLDRCIRISVGPDAALDILAEELPQVLRALR